MGAASGARRSPLAARRSPLALAARRQPDSLEQVELARHKRIRYSTLAACWIGPSNDCCRPPGGLAQGQLGSCRDLIGSGRTVLCMIRPSASGVPRMSSSGSCR